eukprot:CAMPEP_0174737122 /NCGR_PEP_ID=MMETSP1094-20130205/67817_1 /TAXON_ID=156173 /ORGANISM="Chrysochromulina brevifilum, Strain UTEX LB 985" /LENGTH=56 /DNA_ID=CAMNT_0015940307 /DNA_START=294 /DNA_END=465 /DNA_ORIENTATION=+
MPLASILFLTQVIDDLLKEGYDAAVVHRREQSSGQQDDGHVAHLMPPSGEVEGKRQ